MEKLSVANFFGGSRHEIDCNKIPDTCPWCHKGVDPIRVSGFINDSKNEVYYLFMCPMEGCRKFFIGDFEQILDKPDSFILIKTLLGLPKPKEFPAEINSVSENFATIYNQSLSAEHHGLDQICGPGYRKAIEFLIKDYLIQKTPGSGDSIKNMFLSNCIELLPDSNFKEVALRGTWLGNDQTHYVKKWIDQDISDLKNVIDLMVYWMASEKLTEKITQVMPKKN